MIRHRFTSDRKPYANSFLPSCFDIVSCRIGNYTRKVSCRDETLLSHAGWETICQQFPAAMIRHRFTSSRKPYANSFLPSCFDIVSCRIGNYTRKVSCRDETLLSHAGWETICQQFPAAMIRHRFTSSRKPYANSFLPSCFDIVSCRIGNYTRKVSCRDETLLSHAGWETICQQFPAAMIRHRFTSSRKPYANSFLLR